MLSPSLVVLSILTSSLLVNAHPPQPPPPPSYTTCLDKPSAHRVAQNWASLISAFSAANATRVLTADFTDYSDSIITLMNGACPHPNLARNPNGKELGQPVFSSRQQQIDAQATQPDIPFEILDVRHGCDWVVFRWVSNNVDQGSPSTVQPVVPVRGINLADVVRGKKGEEPWIIKTMYAELNSGAWLYDVGAITPQGCSS